MLENHPFYNAYIPVWNEILVSISSKAISFVMDNKLQLIYYSISQTSFHVGMVVVTKILLNQIGNIVVSTKFPIVNVVIRECFFTTFDVVISKWNPFTEGVDSVQTLHCQIPPFGNI